MRPVTPPLFLACPLLLAFGCFGSQHAPPRHGDAGADAAEAAAGDAADARAFDDSGTSHLDAADGQADANEASTDGPATTRDAADGGASTADGDGPLDAPAERVTPSVPGWTFVWSDEFDETAIDEAAWNIIDAPGTKENAELQRYTGRKNSEPGANAFLEGGALVLEAREESLGGFAYTSARLESRGAARFQYGRFEARMKLPAVAGMWPAFWMLGANIGAVGWPACGEIDGMEGKGRLPNWVAGSLHRGVSGDGTGDIVSTSGYTLASGDFHQTWHVFAVEWDAQAVRWYVDGAFYQTVARPAGAAQPWPFDQPFYLLLNLAVGGLFDANVKPPPGTPPQRLLVDYVRVYKKSS